MGAGRDRGRSDLNAGAETPALSVVIPVYNEGENVAPTLRGVVERSRTRPLEVLVVYDFDGDTTVPVVKRLQADIPELQLHRNTIGRGVLNAIKSGLAAARAPYVLVTMGDGSDDAGDIDIPEFKTTASTHPEVMVLDQVAPAGQGSDSWHADNTYLDEPPMGALLQAHILPPVGGDTCFASMYAAYEGLSPAMQAFFDGMTAQHGTAKLVARTKEKALRIEAEVAGGIVDRNAGEPVQREACSA